MGKNSASSARPSFFRRHIVLFIVLFIILALLAVLYSWRDIIRDELYFRTVALPSEMKSYGFEADLPKYEITYYDDSDELDPSLFGLYVTTESTLGKRTDILQDDDLYPLTQDLLVPTADAEEKKLADLLPEERALPYEGLYLNDDDYEFYRTFYARCAYSSAYVKGKLLPVVEKHFQSALPEKSEVCFISAVGDMLLARHVDSILINDEDGVKKVFSTTLPLLQDADYTIGNLECAATNGGVRASKSYTFRFNPSALQGLKDAGFDYLMFTNNHCFDYGLEGFTDTLKALKDYGFATSGAADNLEEARKFHHTEVKGTKLAILSFNAFPTEHSGFDGRNIVPTDKKAGALWYPDDIEDMVRKEKDAGYFVIICVHAGQEYVTKPIETQDTLYHALCDSGADIVLGTHPHVLQAVENYNGSVIAYSLGNFIFPGMDGMAGGTDTMVIRFGICNGRIIYQETYPAKISDTSVALK